jgi:prepilin-type N-terminal cleavage/methylation domain-containing protein
MTRRHGFTLIEILIALVVMGIVTASIYKLLNDNQRLSRAQVEQVSLQSNVRTGSLVVLNELRELNTVFGGQPEQNDIIDMPASGDAIRYRAARGFGFVCQAPTTPIATEIWIRKDNYSGFRLPAISDHLYLFSEGASEDRGDDDVWVQVLGPLVVTLDQPNGCGAGVAGHRIIFPAAAIPATPVGTPVRFYEIMELRLHVADGRSWLGANPVSAGGGVQPMLGPLTAGNGFQLEYVNSAGGTTTNPYAVRAIKVTVRGETDQAVRQNGAGAYGRPQDALVTQVLLRNSVR